MPLPYDFIDDIMDRLSQYGPHIHASNADSVYIHFDNLPQGLDHKMRVSNHPERDAYGYKWQLRVDGIPPKHEQKEWSRYFGTPNKIVSAFINYYLRVELNQSGGVLKSDKPRPNKVFGSTDDL